MQKIISLFQRNYDGDHLVRDEVVPGAEWVPAGEGIATRKWDGTSCLIADGLLYKRYDAKAGKKPPLDFEPAQPEPDPKTGHWPGWVPVTPDDPADRWHRVALEAMGAHGAVLLDGTYELVGPKVNGGKDGLADHVLIRHGINKLLNAPRDFDGIRAYLTLNSIEGIVWHHGDGRMVKIKARDFGIPWPRK